MHVTGSSPAIATCFNDLIIRKNALSRKGFSRWAFYRGMLFASTEKWWGDFGRRNSPHEGVDLCYYMDRQKNVRLLSKNTKIPVMLDGTVIQLIDDYLGKSIVMEHGAVKSQHAKFITIYGHTNPEGNIHIGKCAAAGDFIATLADTRMSPSGLPCHLHISAGWMPDHVSFDSMNWKNIPETVSLIDPLDFILNKDEIVLLQK